MQNQGEESHAYLFIPFKGMVENLQFMRPAYKLNLAYQIIRDKLPTKFDRLYYIYYFNHFPSVTNFRNNKINLMIA